jgi:integrase
MGIRIEQCLFISVEERGGLNKAIEKTGEIEDFLRNKKDWRELFQIKQSKSILIGEIWDDFVNFGTEGSIVKKRKAWRLQTVVHYRSTWENYYSDFWADKLPSEIDEESWKKFIAHCYKKSSKGENLIMFNIFKYWRAFCAYMVVEGSLKKMPTIWNPDPTPEDEDGAGIVYPDEALRKMIVGSSGAFKLYVMMGALMGMRSSEITQLRKDRIDEETRGIRLKAADVKTGSKTNKGRFIPIPDAIWKFLVEQMDSHPDSSFIFPNFRKDNGDRPMDRTGFKKPWKALKESVGFPDGRFHDLRHTYATNVFSNPKINPVLACKALGMSMQTAERVYIHPNETHFRLITENFNYGKLI